MRASLFTLTLLPLAAACAPQPPTAPTQAMFPARLQTLGTEPFWSIAIDGANIAYSSPDEPAKRSARVERREDNGKLVLEGTLSGSPIIITIISQSCSDGMSDRDYPYSAKVRLGERSLEGCARPPDAAST